MGKKKTKKFAEGGYQGREGQKALNLNTGKNRPEEITPNRSNSQDKGPYGEQFAKLFEGLRQDKSPYGEQSAKLFGMKHGGKVKGKKCRMDGIAIRGKTRAKERSK